MAVYQEEIELVGNNYLIYLDFLTGGAYLRPWRLRSTLQRQT